MCSVFLRHHYKCEACQEITWRLWRLWQLLQKEIALQQRVQHALSKAEEGSGVAGVLYWGCCRGALNKS